MEAKKHYCNLCKTEKDEALFYRTKDGKIRAGCRACRCDAVSKNQKGRYGKNPEAAKARHKRWVKKHPDQFREIMRLAIKANRRNKREAGTQPLFELPPKSPPPHAAGPPSSPPPQSQSSHPAHQLPRISNPKKP